MNYKVNVSINHIIFFISSLLMNVYSKFNTVAAFCDPDR